MEELKNSISKQDLRKMRQVFRSLEWIASYNYSSSHDDIQDYLRIITYGFYQEFIVMVNEYSNYKYNRLDKEINWYKQRILDGECDPETGDRKLKTFENKISSFKQILQKGYEYYLNQAIDKAEKRYMEVLDLIVENLDIDWFNFTGSITIKKFNNENNILLHFLGDDKNYVAIINRQYTGYGNSPSLRLVSHCRHHLFYKYERIHLKKADQQTHLED